MMRKGSSKLILVLIAGAVIVTMLSSCMSSHTVCSSYASNTIAGGSDTAMVVSSIYITNGRTVTK